MKLEYKIFVKGTPKAYLDSHMVISEEIFREVESLNDKEKTIELYYHVYSHAEIDKIKDLDRTEIIIPSFSRSKIFCINP